MAEKALTVVIQEAYIFCRRQRVQFNPLAAIIACAMYMKCFLSETGVHSQTRPRKWSLSVFGGVTMRTHRVIHWPLFAMTFAVLALSHRAAWSSACNEEIVVKIHFAASDVCWNYRGNATTFVGKFASGQNVEVRMSGESVSYDPNTKQDVTSWVPRTPSVTGPGDFIAQAEMDNVLSFRTPRSGSYRIGFSPCAMWGGKGEVRICTK